MQRRRARVIARGVKRKREEGVGKRRKRKKDGDGLVYRGQSHA